MNVIPLHVKDARIIDIQRFKDHRGFLEELYNCQKYPEDITSEFEVKQNTCSRSHQNVIRGLHISPYAKLLTCIQGAVYDVVVDLRPESPSYMQWAAAILTEDNLRQLYIPPNCGHGFLSLKENSTVVYCQGGFFHPSIDFGITPFDPVADVYWPIPKDASAIISEKDEKALPAKVEGGVLPKRTRVLIIGASGQVGGALKEAVAKRPDMVSIGTCGEHPQECLIPFDMEKAASDPSIIDTLFTACRPAIVCICAAFSWVDGNEKFPEKAKAINLTAVTKLTEAAKAIGAKTVFYSSDYVFDGATKQNGLASGMAEIYANSLGYSETDTANPLNNYGSYKLDAEKAVLATDPSALVLRISRVYGPEVQGKNFVFQLTNNIQAGKSLNCLTDEISCPTYNRDIAEATLELARKDLSGLFHCTGPQALSKLQWGIEVCKYFNLDSGKLNPIEGQQQGTANRPKVAVMSSQKLSAAIPDVKFHTISEALKDWQENPRGKLLNL
ncbi:unnamed protein product [Owenia fusiformis]|uniref:Methionine adenosyltransferase 2 subunit beta n=1 Tax=Owenia fusiformis TaxID=6347 RepID=A0A8S4N411_OWEFU|nr:unnamed protein product [Owenia fusiformis]